MTFFRSHDPNQLQPSDQRITCFYGDDGLLAQVYCRAGQPVLRVQAPKETTQASGDWCFTLLEAPLQLRRLPAVLSRGKFQFEARRTLMIPLARECRDHLSKPFYLILERQDEKAKDDPPETQTT